MRLTEAPPTQEAGQGLASFLAVGQRFLQHFRDAGLEPHHRILDMGCGSGRAAVALADFSTAGYEGFDVSKERIRWAQKHITRERRDFRFQHVKVRNGVYAQKGRSAKSFHFPYEDQSFDFAIAVSLFTHLVHEDVEHYLAETARVLKPGGRLFATFFLLDDVSRAYAAAGRSQWMREDYRDGAMAQEAARPELAIGYPEEWVLARLRQLGLEPVEVQHGTWSERADGVDYQDAVIARRVPST